MKKVLLLILLTATAFAAGLAAGLWSVRHCSAVPRPPTSLFSEFWDVTRPGSTLQALVKSRPELACTVNCELEKLRPDIDAFRQKMRAIETDFRTQVDAMLRTDQQARFAALHKRHDPTRRLLKESTRATPAPQEVASAPSAAPAQPTSPARDTKVTRMYFDSIEAITAIVCTSYTLERYACALQLDATQKQQLLDLLHTRRDRFIQLVDTESPPSMKLGYIAEFILQSESAAPQPKP